ncbi:MAG: response regulator [bacterium]
MSIIAIVSGIYCSGDEIAGRVAERLEYDLVGGELAEEAAQRFGTTVDKLNRALSGDRALFNIITHDHEKSVVYLRAALAELVAKGNVVYHGVATHLIPRSISHVLRVGLIAEEEYRVSQAAEIDKVDAKEARSRIKRGTKGLQTWTQEQLGRTPWDPALFDLKIPVGTKTVDEAVELIHDALTQDALRPTDRSIQAAVDFLLAMQVNLTLLERGQYRSDVTADRGKVTVLIKSKPAPPGKIGRTMHTLKHESWMDEARALALGIEGVKQVDVRPVAQHSKTLLVDDEREYVVTLSERLGMRDIEADIAYDGSEALDRVQAGEPEVMVLDLKMPGLDGFEVLKRVKKDHPRVEVIVLTGHGSEHDEKAVRDLGAFDYLRKPVDIATLAERIRAAREKARSTDEE